MEVTLLYLIRLSIVWGILLAYYHFTFQKNANWRLRRWFLLGSYVLGLLIPLVPSMEFHSTILAPMKVVLPINFEASLPVQSVDGSVVSNVSWTSIFISIYLLVCLIKTIQLLHSTHQLIHLKNTGTSSTFAGFKLIHHHNINSPFAAFNQIFLPKSLQPELEKVACYHEAAHLEHQHPQERLLLAIAGVMFWFHPLHWIFERQLSIAQEHQADEAVLQHIRIKTYGHILIQQSMNSSSSWKAGLFTSPLKKRIQVMIHPNKSQPWQIKQIFIFIGLVACLAISCSNLKDSTTLGMANVTSLDQVDQQPILVGNNSLDQHTRALLEKIYKNVKYPVEARRAGVMAKLQATFVITEKGKMEQINVSTVELNQGNQSLNEVVIIGYKELDIKESPSTADVEPLKNEVIRVLNDLQDWEPATKDGSPVATQLSLGFKFLLE